MAVLALLAGFLPHRYRATARLPCDVNAMDLHVNGVEQMWQAQNWAQLFTKAEDVANIATACYERSRGINRLTIVYGRALALQMMGLADVETDRVSDGKSYFRLADADFAEAAQSPDSLINSEAVRKKMSIEELLASPDIKTALKNRSRFRR